jgi:pseudouridine-5'-phosphate glycosidase
MSPAIQCSSEVSAALAAGGPVVALESTIIAHGLPWPTNLETALAAEAAVRQEGATPATIGVWYGTPVIGLGAEQLQWFAQSSEVRKASRRDLAAAVVDRACAATTVAATMALAAAAGVRVFATGGIGGVHPWQPGSPPDVSADLFELARVPVAVVCAGAKSILDLSATLEVLETLGVPVVGVGTSSFPAFYLADSGLPVSARVDGPVAAARFLEAHWQLGGAGAVLAQPLPAEQALAADRFAATLATAQADAQQCGVRGPALTPFLLRRLAELTGGDTLRANQALIVANARLAAGVAAALTKGERYADSGDR